MADSYAAIEARGIWKSYHRLRRAVEVLRGIDLVVQSGETVGLIGRNGAGKTTLLMCLTGLLHYRAELIRVCGFAPDSTSARLHVGFVPERLTGNGSVTAAEFLFYLGALSRMRRGSLHKRVDFLLARFELQDHRHRKLGTFSRGMLQRLALCQALLHEPRLLILDEPTSALDPPGISLFHSILQEEKLRGTAILLSSHQLADIQEFCNRTYLLVEGRLSEVQGPLRADRVFVDHG